MKKATLHFPTEQYGFAEVEIEVESPHEAVLAYKEAQEKLQTGKGIDEKEMNQVVDSLLNGESVVDGVEIYERMNEQQRYTSQVIKRAIKRLNYKE